MKKDDGVEMNVQEELSRIPDYGSLGYERRSWVEKIAPVLMVLVVIMSFALGSLWSKVKYLENGVSQSPTQPTTVDGQQQEPDAPAVPNVTLKDIKALFSKDVLKFGDANRKVLFVEFADPSCPFCHVAVGLNPALNEQMDPATNRFKLVSDGGTYLPPMPEIRKLVDSGKASLVMIYTPGHGAGEMGMKAMYCAFEQGKFWQVHDALYTKEGYSLLNDTVKNDKAKSGVLSDFLKRAADANKLKSCLDSNKYDARISADVKLAKLMGSRGTPGFWVNDKFFNGAYDYSEMKSVVDAALK